MIKRQALERLKILLGEFPAVALLGPRQVGKTTLARELASQGPSLYLDLEDPETRAVLKDRAFLEGHLDKLVVLDEVQRAPDLFWVLRGLIDQARQAGTSYGRYLLLGSASNELLAQSESLAGRISYVELTGVLVSEFSDADRLWVRGGLPDSLLASSDDTSMRWRRNFVRTYLERDIPMLAGRLPAETLDRFWTMLAHCQAGLWNGEKLAAGLGISGSTVSRYLDTMVDLMLVRRLRPWHGNVKRRLIKSPKVYIRDTGILHERLGISDKDALIRHPVVGSSWEGFVIENLIQAAGEGCAYSFYHSAKGDELDLIIESGARRIAVEIKHSRSPALEAGAYRAVETTQSQALYVVYPGKTDYHLEGGAHVFSLERMTHLLSTREWLTSETGR